MRIGANRGPLIALVLGGVVAVLAGVLTVRTLAASVDIDGNTSAPMTQGTVVPVNLRFSNGFDFTMALSDLRVTVGAVDAPNADKAHPCGASDYRIDQPSGSVRFDIQAGEVVTLRDLRIPVAQWPQVRLIERKADQSGCVGATLKLRYWATRELALL